MTSTTRISLVSAFALAFAFGSFACSDKAADSSKKKAPAAKKANKTAADKPKTNKTAADKPKADDKPKAPKPKADPATLAAVSAVMKPYESCRALLADDKGAGVSVCAKAIASAANDSKAPEAAKPHMTQIAAAAKRLAVAKATDIAAVRLSFGGVSKSVVAMLGAIPGAADKYHVFECPMAKGYKRWVQVDKKMANPYMGKAMLTCGTKVSKVGEHAH